MWSRIITDVLQPWGSLLADLGSPTTGVGLTRGPRCYGGCSLICASCHQQARACVMVLPLLYSQHAKDQRCLPAQLSLSSGVEPSRTREDLSCRDRSLSHFFCQNNYKHWVICCYRSTWKAHGTTIRWRLSSFSPPLVFGQSSKLPDRPLKGSSDKTPPPPQICFIHTNMYTSTSGKY